MHDWQPSTFRLDANLLKNDFTEATSTQLLSVPLSAIKPATEENGRYLVGILKPVAERLRHLLVPSTGFTATQGASVQHALGLALYVIGEQAGDNNVLTDATKAYRAALKERSRDRVPLDWAMSTGNQSVALMLIAERLGDATRAQTAVQQIEVAFVTMRDGAGTRTPPRTTKRNCQRPGSFSIG
jgi:hypothetical protein